MVPKPSLCVWPRVKCLKACLPSSSLWANSVPISQRRTLRPWWVKSLAGWGGAGLCPVVAHTPGALPETSGWPWLPRAISTRVAREPSLSACGRASLSRTGPGPWPCLRGTYFQSRTSLWEAGPVTQTQGRGRVARTIATVLAGSHVSACQTCCPCALVGSPW